MKEIRLVSDDIGREQVEAALGAWLSQYPRRLRKVLLLPPDFTRGHSQAGLIVQILYRMLAPKTQVDIMPALGTHVPLSRDERLEMFGPDIPEKRFLVHNWRTDVVKIGEVPASYVAEVSEGLVDYAVDVEVNSRLLDPGYDAIMSIGQVVPHEVVGMANYTKNVLVGCGGKSMIDKTHFLGAVYGMERLMGRDHSPVRRLFDYAEEHFLHSLPLQYILTVTTAERGRPTIKGLFAGRDRSLFEEAVRLSRKHNFDLLDKPLRKVVVYLDPSHFKSTWLGNKAIYRTRMAIADRGELIIIAPGVRQFGEDQLVDGLIRKYGYSGTPRILEMVRQNEDLRGSLSAAAHLIHGSSEGRFDIVYAPGHLTRTEIEGVGFGYMPLDEAIARFNPDALHDGYNTVGGEEIFYVSNPSLGLWSIAERFAD
jgi:nickel-dependent lactate racemase